MSHEPRFLNPLIEIEKHGEKLPHWQQDASTYFVTFHLADSIPQARLDPWREARDAWMLANPKPWTPVQARAYHAQFTRHIERWLDAGSGLCVLRNPAAARIVGDALQYFAGMRCRPYAWVVMPNHVHVLFSILAEHDLEDLLQSWKGYSARRINQLFGRRGALWQANYFDRLIRNRRHFVYCLEYIRKNPLRASLRDGEFLLHVEEE